jgi:hypothetical protein
MKPTKKLAGGILLVLMMCGLSFALVSWSGDRDGQDRLTQNDTIPKKIKQPRNLDEVLAELESLDIKSTIEDAMKNVDMEKIQLQIEQSMKDIDFDKMEKELKESIAKIDLGKLELELKEAMKEIDFEKMQIELKESLKEIDFDKMKLELEKVKEVDLKEVREEMKKVKEEMKNLGPQLEKELEEARVEIEKAKSDLREFKGFVDGLEKDGLIDKKAGYTLKHEDGELLINGKKAPADVYNKYREFLQKHKKFTLKQDDDKFDFDND